MNGVTALIDADTPETISCTNPDTHHHCSVCREFHTKDMFPKSKNEWNGVYHMCK